MKRYLGKMSRSMGIPVAQLEKGEGPSALEPETIIVS